MRQSFPASTSLPTLCSPCPAMTSVPFPLHPLQVLRNCRALGEMRETGRGEMIKKWGNGAPDGDTLGSLIPGAINQPPNGSQAIREGRGGRRSQIFPLNERHDFHHCFCCPGNQGQPSGEYSKRTPCLSLLSDPLPCTPFPDHLLAPRPAPNFS